jgi:uncharacterized membrane protein
MSISDRVRRNVTPRRLLLVVSLSALVWTAGIFLVPWLAASGADAGWLRLIYRPMCHQIPERCLILAGAPAAMCARCAGLCIGGSAGLLFVALTLSTLRGSRVVWLIAATAPTFIDVGARLVGLQGLANIPRLLVALPAGLVLGLLLGEALIELARRTNGKSPRSPEGRPVYDLTENVVNSGTPQRSGWE